MRKRYYDFLSLSFAGILYVFSIIKATLVPMHVPIKTWHILLFAIGFFLFYFLINTKIGHIVFLSVVTAGLCLGLFFIFRNGISNLSKTFAPFIKLVNLMIQVGTGYYDETVSFTSLIIAVGIYSLFVALPIYYFLVQHFRFYLLITPGVFFFTIVWGLNRHVDKLSFYVFITVAIICYIRHIFLVNLRKNQNSSETINDRNILVYFIPVALIVILFSAAIPVSQRPIEWPWLDEKIYDLWWNMQNKFSIERYDTYSLAKTGFGDPSRLGGPVYADSTPILLVKAPTRVYLRGAVYDNYTGSGWVLTDKSEDNYLEDRVYDHRELLHGWKAASAKSGIWTIERYEEHLINGVVLSDIENVSEDQYVEFLKLQTKPRILQMLFPEKEISVQHLNVRTKSLFTPLKMFLPITGLSSEVYKLNENTEGVFQSDRRLRGNSTYHVDYLQPAYGMKELENYFHLSKPGLYAGFNEYTEELIEQKEKENSQSILRQELTGVVDIYKNLERRRDEIYHLYTNIPEETPERVIELAQMITATSSTTYAKVKSLENYLRLNYNYTLLPKYPPAHQDFVDYFLFDGKEGYCSYFASALCVMTRAVGIPSRYVEGFLLPEESDSNDRYQVTNQNAHAWVEVYLEGVGWVTFEPTPPMAGAQNYYVRLYEIEAGEEGLIPELPEDYDQAQPIQNGFLPGIGGNYSESTRITLKTILMCILALVLIALIVNLLFMFIRWVILHLISPKKSIRLLYSYTVSLLSQAGSSIQPGETPKDFAKLVDKRYAFSPMSMTEMVELYYSVRFGTHDLDKKVLKHIFSFVSEVKTKTGKNMYFIKRLLLRCLLFRG